MELLTTLSWPLAVTIVGIVAVVVLRKPLGGLIDRTERIERIGLEAGRQKAGGQLAASPVEDLINKFDRTLVDHWEGHVRQQFESVSADETGPEKERKIFRFVAALVLTQMFERTYVSIYGSQIGVLELLNTAVFVPHGASLEVIKPWYEQAATREPEFYETYSFRQWLGFLETAGLVTVADEKVAITSQGREFLKWIVQMGYPRYRDH